MARLPPLKGECTHADDCCTTPIALRGKLGTTAGVAWPAKPKMKHDPFQVRLSSRFADRELAGARDHSPGQQSTRLGTGIARDGRTVDAWSEGVHR